MVHCTMRHAQSAQRTLDIGMIESLLGPVLGVAVTEAAELSSGTFAAV